MGALLAGPAECGADLGCARLCAAPAVAGPAGERRSHSVATPRGGGIAIVISLLVTAGVAMWAWPEAAPTCWWPALAWCWWPASAGGTTTGPCRRCAACWCISSPPRCWPAWSRCGGSWLLAVLVLLFTASLINIWNFMDGINGIAASQALWRWGWRRCCPGRIRWPPWRWAWPAWVPAVQLPAGPDLHGRCRKWRAGVCGRRVLAIASVRTDINWILLLVPVSPFLVDAGFTLLARIISGQRWMEPHTQHVYQRAVQAGASHPR
jgi:UDP-N-acetylmuramyl pentapeptide phosphotransferase/UDP-N-acetylglucosamine-1-phosphate transferase